MQTVIYLIRHAAYENPKNIFHGRLPGFPLSQEGKNQAKKLARALRGNPIVAVYSSPLLRTLQTAKIIAKAFRLDVTVDDRLMDVRTPVQGKPLVYVRSLRSIYLKEFIAAGGERMSEVAARMESFFRETIKIHLGQEIIVVSHGDPIMSVKLRALHLRLSVANLGKDYIKIGQGYKLVVGSNKSISISPLQFTQ